MWIALCCRCFHEWKVEGKHAPTIKQSCIDWEEDCPECSATGAVELPTNPLIIRIMKETAALDVIRESFPKWHEDAEIRFG